MHTPDRRRFILTSASLLAGLSLVPVLTAAETPVPEFIGPYLQNPTPDGMTVCFLARGAAGVKILPGAQPQATPVAEAALEDHAIPKVSWTAWKVRCRGLRPGSLNSYRISWRTDAGERVSAEHAFRTPDPAAPEVRAISLNDLHEHTATLRALMKQVKPDDYEFSILLGDIWDGIPSDRDGARVFRFFADVVDALDAGNKPVLFVRGNHDWRGDLHPQLGFLFDIPGNDPAAAPAEQRFWHDWRYGPAWFIANDTGEDGIKRPGFFDPYRGRQTDWLRGLFAADPQADARWRVHLAHIPLYVTGGSVSADSRERWAPILNRAGVSVSLNAHQHRAQHLEKGKTYQARVPEGDGWPPAQAADEPIPYDVLIAGGNALSGRGAATVTKIHADAEQLRIRMVTPEGGTAVKLDLDQPARPAQAAEKE